MDNQTFVIIKDFGKLTIKVIILLKQRFIENMLERNAYMMNKYSINITKNLNLEHVVVNATNNMKNYEKNIDMDFFWINTR